MLVSPGARYARVLLQAHQIRWNDARTVGISPWVHTVVKFARDLICLVMLDTQEPFLTRPQTTIAVAQVLFHRFLNVVSFYEFDLVVRLLWLRLVTLAHALRDPAGLLHGLRVPSIKDRRDSKINRKDSIRVWISGRLGIGEEYQAAASRVLGCKFNKRRDPQLRR